MDIITLDMNEADGYAVTEFDLVRRALKKERKYRKGLLYRGFDADNIPRLLETGQDTDSKYLSCASEGQIIDPRRESTADVFFYANKHANPAIAVFDLGSLKEVFEYGYEFKDPNKKLEALVGVYRLRY